MDENLRSSNLDYKEISDRLRRRLTYREHQLTALRQSLNQDGPLNESFVSNSAVSDSYPRVVEEIRRSVQDTNFQEMAEMRLKLKETSEQLSFQTRRANLLNDRLSELEHRGVVASSHSRVSEEEISRLRSRVAELESERQSLLSQTAGLEHTRTILKKQIEKINDMKTKARTSGTQTDGGLRLSRDELELRVLRSELEHKNTEICHVTQEISRLQHEISVSNTRAHDNTEGLRRELSEAREMYEHKISGVKREAIKAHTELTHGHQEELGRVKRETEEERKSLIAEYERKLDSAIKVREQAMKASAESALVEKCRSLKISLTQISDQHKAQMDGMKKARVEYEKEVRREMEIFEVEMNRERDSFKEKLEKAERKISDLSVLSKRLDEQLKNTIGNCDELEVSKAAAIQTLENFCREKDERINMLTLEFERAKDAAEHGERKFQRQQELWNSEHEDIMTFESEKSKNEISRLVEVLELEKRKFSEVYEASTQEISELKLKVSNLQSEISKRDLALQSEETKAQYAVEVKNMEISTLKNFTARLEERVFELETKLERQRKEAAETAELDRKFLLEVERNLEAADSRVWSLEAALEEKESEISRLKAGASASQAEFETEISDLQLATRDEKEKLKERLEIQEAEISVLKTEREIISRDLREKASEATRDLREKASEATRLGEKLRVLETRQSEIFAKNVVESGNNPENFTLVSRQLKLETTALIDHLSSGRGNTQLVQELQTEIARLQESRETLRASAKDVCDKVEVMTAKYRRTQQELQQARHEAKTWQDRFLQN